MNNYHFLVSERSEHFGFGIMMVNPFSLHGSRTVTTNLSALAPTSNTAVMQNYRLCADACHFCSAGYLAKPQKVT